jgi:hypothetical protein
MGKIAAQERGSHIQNRIFMENKQYPSPWAFPWVSLRSTHGYSNESPSGIEKGIR